MGGLVLRLFVRNLDLMLPKLTRPLLSFNLYSYITFNIYLYNPFLIVLLLEEPWDRSKVFTFHGVLASQKEPPGCLCFLLFADLRNPCSRS